MTNAVALDSMGQSVSMMAGPALGGGLIAVLGVKGGIPRRYGLSDDLPGPHLSAEADIAAVPPRSR